MGSCSGNRNPDQQGKYRKGDTQVTKADIQTCSLFFYRASLHTLSDISVAFKKTLTASWLGAKLGLHENSTGRTVAFCSWNAPKNALPPVSGKRILRRRQVSLRTLSPQGLSSLLMGHCFHDDCLRFGLALRLVCPEILPDDR